MRLTPDQVKFIGGSLDHPECVCLAADGTLYAGGEAGQIYRVTPADDVEQIGCTGGFVLGLAADGDGSVHACDFKRQAVLRIDPAGNVAERSRGTAQHPMQTPNAAVFDAAGNLYVSDSGDYWSTTGTGCIFRIRPDNHTECFHPGPLPFPNGLAIDPTGRWLYVVLSTRSAVARLALSGKPSELEVTHQLPAGTVPDGIAMTAEGELVIACYKPDALFLGGLDGSVRLLHEDPTGELLNRPTNAAIHDGRLYIANLGGWHLTVVDTALTAGPIHHPRLS